MSYIYNYNVNVDNDLDEILDDMDEDDVLDLVKNYTGLSLTTWSEIYEKRRSMTDSDFLVFIDKTIMDATGRVL